MADGKLGVPKPEPSDADDVVLGLQTAATLWKRGDTQDAIRWIRRAAEAAGEIGNDARALALARVAADLSMAHEQSAKTSPRPLPRPPPPSAQISIDATPRPNPVHVGRDEASLVGRRPPPPSTIGATPSSISNAKPAPMALSGRGGEALSEVTSVAQVDDTSPTRGRSTSPTSLRSLRVAVVRSTEDSGLLMVRVLAEDQMAEKGEKNALLVATDAIVEQLVRPLA